MIAINRETASDAFTPAPGRPVLGVVLHDTEGTTPVMPRRGASWHWLVDRDGTIYRDVDEADCAHHVRAADRWRPSWVVASPIGVSDVNYCSVGIELVSHQNDRDAGEPYTDAQYAALDELAADIERRWGSLPWVGHGQLQRDRSDPVMFDWRRAAFELGDDGCWWRQPAEEEEEEEDDDMALTDAERALVELHREIGVTREGTETLINQQGRGAELGRELVDLGGVLSRSRLASGQRRHYGRRVAALGEELAAWGE